MPENISEENFHCGICFELLVDPTTLTCGHSICRYCLAQWWIKSKKSTCPECRQVWQGFPKVNVTLRNTISLLFPDKIEERTNALKENKDYKKTIKRFDDHGKEKKTSLINNLNWSLVCIIVAITVAVAVIIGVSIKKLSGLTQSDLMSKSLRDWTPEEVGMWISTLGPWINEKGFDKKFIELGVDGSLLLQLSDEDLKSLPINMPMEMQRRTVLKAIQDLKDTMSKHISGFWEYKEQKSGMTMFIMFGLREFPRSTLAYLYLLNYWDTFIPIFYHTVTIDGNHKNSDLMEMEHIPTIENWLEFLPKYFVVPYYLVGTFASHFLHINYWTSRVVIMHAVLMTVMEFTNIGFLFTIGIRQFPYMAMKNFLYVCFISICCKLLWPIVPFFVADCVFYWMLYVSPFDALNRLRKRFTRTQQPQQQDEQQQDYVHHHEETRHLVNEVLDNHAQFDHGFLHHHGGGGGMHEQETRGWRFNFEWNHEG